MNEAIASWFDGCQTADQARQIITRRPEPLESLYEIEPRLAAEVLSQALRESFIPNAFTIEFIQEMVGRAALHARALFSSEREYARGLYEAPAVDAVPVCFTGLAGVGKSQTIAALRKVLPGPVDLSCDHFQGELPLRSHWYASARGTTNAKALLREFVELPLSRLTVAELLSECRRRANRDGVSLVILDEMQYIQKGLGAAKVTDILLNMAGIGPPMVYVCNYSLGHKLFERNNEDQQRLLTDPRIMLPDEPGSSDWKAFIDECVRVGNGAIRGNQGELAREIYRCTFGIKRLAVELLKQAYIECRSAGRHAASLQDIGHAYRSAAYTSSAKQVEHLQKLALGGRVSKQHPDLRCPFDLPAAFTSNVVKFARAERQDRVTQKVFDSSLTASERSVKKQLDASANALQKPTARPRRTPVEELSEEEQAKAFFALMEDDKDPKPK